MSRLLLLGLVIFVVIYLIKQKWIRGAHSPVNTEEPKQPPSAENMVKCAYCGTHTPLSSAIQQHDAYYCSESHLPRT